MRIVLSAMIAGLLLTGTAQAADIKVLTAGAFKPAVLALQPGFEQETGHRLVIDNDTTGGLARRIEAGEPFDIVIVTPAGIDSLTAKGKVAAGSRQDIARTGIGVMVRENAAKPDIATPEALKAALLAARTVAYIDPASGGSSGIYLAGLFEKIGIAEVIRPKARLKNGGYVADLVSSGEAEIGLHQISEILPAKGVTLVGPLPAEWQNFTTYSSGLGANASDVAAAKMLLSAFRGARAAAALKGMGMELVP